MCKACVPPGKLHPVPTHCQVCHGATANKTWLLQVEAEIEAAKKSEFPPIEDLWNNIYADGLGAKLRPIEISKPKIQL